MDGHNENVTRHLSDSGQKAEVHRLSGVVQEDHLQVPQKVRAVGVQLFVPFVAKFPVAPGYQTVGCALADCNTSGKEIIKLSVNYHGSWIFIWFGQF